MSWAEDGVPPNIDRSNYRRRSQEGEKVWERRQPIKVKDPTDWNRVIELIRWLKPGGISPNIINNPNAWRDEIEKIVFGVNYIQSNPATRTVKMEVDHRRSFDPLTGNPGKETPYEYILQFDDVNELIVKDAREVLNVMIQRASGLEPEKWSDFIIQGYDDQYKCKISFDERGKSSNLYRGWEINCEYMTPEERATYYPDTSAQDYLTETKGGYSYNYSAEDRKAVTMEQKIEGAKAKIKYWKRCPNGDS